ncbi:MAG: acyl-CoA dehydrogenase family protein [Spongiibacteraceae bacterium]
MNFELNDEQRMLVDAAGRYVRETFDLELRRKVSATDEGFSRDRWANFADMGWLALSLPEEADGLGWGVIELSLLMEQLGRGLINEPVIDTSILCASVLSSASNNTKSLDLLSRIGTGAAIVALAHIEPGGRSEFETTIDATLTAKTGELVLNGTKRYVYFGHVADQLLVTAKLDGEQVVVVVPSEAEGIRCNSYVVIDGTRAADITFSNVSVEKDAVVLRGAAVTAALELAFDLSIVANCSAAVGSMETVMDMTAEYLKQREQYGKPLAQFQALQHRLAEMLVETEQARSILLRTLSLFDDPIERRAAVSGAKVLISKSARWVAGQGIQLHGGIGTTEEFAVGHHYKAMLVLEERFGSSDWHLDQCANKIGQDATTKA